MSHLKALPSTYVPSRDLSYSVLDNGKEIAVLFPFIPGIEDITAHKVHNAPEGSLDTYNVHVESAGGIGLIAHLPPKVQVAFFQSEGVLFVGIDALSRPVFECRLTLPMTA